MWLRGNLLENSEEISSVALLSPACFSFIFYTVYVNTETNLVEGEVTAFPQSTGNVKQWVDIL